MKRIWLKAIMGMAALAAVVGAASAARLRVEPVLLEIDSPAAAGSLTLRNDDDFDFVVQTRVFRWSQVNGIESLEPTTDVVASPPSVKLAPGADYTVRVVRTSKQPVRGEESYRVVVDQLPDVRRKSLSTINILIRQSIPVFFRAQQMTVPKVSWSLHYDSGKLVVTTRNDGDQHLRIASLRLRDAAGATVNFGNGLAGYALGRSSMNFVVPSPPRGFGAGGSVSVSAESNNGPVDAAVLLQPRR